MRHSIRNSRESAAYIQAVRKSFDESVESYRRYRANQCQLREALSAMGNASAEIKLACETELDANRSERLKAGRWWLE